MLKRKPQINRKFMTKGNVIKKKTIRIIFRTLKILFLNLKFYFYTNALSSAFFFSNMQNLVANIKQNNGKKLPYPR